MKMIFPFLAACLLMASFASADLITPGFRSIEITNQITNTVQYPDYVFISGGGINTNMCPFQQIEQGGMINGYYKHCSPSVYALSKSNFNSGLLERINSMQTIEEAVDYLNGLGSREVIKNIETYMQVPELIPTDKIDRYYTVNIEELLTSPTEEKTENNQLLYVYIILPVIGILAVIYIVMKRRKPERRKR
jgi:hypothetical protein